MEENGKTESDRRYTYDNSGRMGALVARYSYDEWGNCTVMNPDGTVNTNADFLGNINPFRYRGYYYDTESNLYYLMSRYYDPEIGQFISMDSVDYLDPDEIGGVDLYAYCRNNPIMYIDLDGHSLLAIILILATTTIIGGVVSAKIAADEGKEGWDFVSDVILGIAMGFALGGIIVGLIGVIAGAIAGPSYMILGLTAANWYNWGALAVGLIAAIIALLYGIKMEGI